MFTQCLQYYLFFLSSIPAIYPIATVFALVALKTRPQKEIKSRLATNPIINSKKIFFPPEMSFRYCIAIKLNVGFQETQGQINNGLSLFFNDN